MYNFIKKRLKMKKLLFLLLPFIVFAKEYIFAASWQDGYCAINHTRECNREYNYFTIHGLWPKKQNCNGVKHFRLPKPLWDSLKTYMPSSKLIYHEWRKHGRCYSKDPIVYFSDSLYLIQKINDDFKDFFNKHKILTKQQLNKFINSLYPHTARKVKMICKKGYITELRFSLNGDIHTDSFYKLLKNGKNLKGGCDRGIVK